jgi:hypothetical protein
MGFQAADIVDFGRGLLGMPGVTGAWYLPAGDGMTATLYVLVEGFNPEGFRRRLAVREAIEDFVEAHDTSMRDSGFGFIYEVGIDDDALGSPQVPDGAEPIAA